MSDYDVLERLAFERERVIRRFLHSLIGHEPTTVDMKRFTIISNLYETRIYRNGNEICFFRFHPRDEHILVEMRTSGEYPGEQRQPADF